MSEAQASLAHWERWSVQRVSPAVTPHSAPFSAHAAASAIPSPAQRQAFEQGRAQGRREAEAAAHAQGLALGREQGLTLGLEQGREQGRDEALAQLREAAEQDAKARLDQQAARLHTLAAALPQALARAEEELAQTLTDLALAIARQVVGQALATDPGLVLPAVRELLQAEPALSGQPQLLLHPEDLALVREHLAEELLSAGWRLRADATLARGGCRVTAASGELDARLCTRWQRVAAALSCEPEPAPVAPEALA